MRCVLWLAGALLLGANPARATAPAPSPQPLRWSIALERLFGVSRTWSNEVDGQRQTSTSLGLGARYLEHPGYGTPRVGVDLLLGPGISLGAGLGYAHYTQENPDERDEESYAVLAPRVGFALQPLPGLVVWPRAGLTLLLPGRQTPEDHHAVSLELPAIWRLPGGAIGLSATPHLDLGFSGGSGSTDERVSEVGLALGANLFF
jgi:hypothetical protein